VRDIARCSASDKHTQLPLVIPLLFIMARFALAVPCAGWQALLDPAVRGVCRF
jgi:hypothetical protein